MQCMHWAFTAVCPLHTHQVAQDGVMLLDAGSLVNLQFQFVLPDRHGEKTDCCEA